MASSAAGHLGILFSPLASQVPRATHIWLICWSISPFPVPVWLQIIATPLCGKRWREELWGHPDRAFRDYIISGIFNGFRLGFNYSIHACKPASRNMQSAIENPTVVQAYIDMEVALGRLLGPVHPQIVPQGTQLSPFGVIPKTSQPGKWRLILNLSSPDGGSVNEGIEPDLCSLQYFRLDEVVRYFCTMDPGALLAKMDIDAAYRKVPVHPADRLLLGMQWNGSIFVDTRLPFGLRSAPKIFSAVADALQWVFEQNGVTWVGHYLDDYITIGPHGSQECGDNLHRMLAVCQRLGVPVAESKCAGPASTMVFLGFEIDTMSRIIKLPAPKLQRTLALVKEWMGRKVCKRRELESLLGHLQHAATVVRPGRTFVRRLIELLSVAKSKGSWVRLNTSTRSDLVWWVTFIEGWNGVTMMPNYSLPSIRLETDASGSWGCGAKWGSKWLQWRWEGSSQDWAIAPKELLPILFAIAIWGSQWAGSLVECHCDNMAVVAVINSGRCKDPTLMHLLRCLFFMAAHFSITVKAFHIPGVENIAADAISRNDLSRFMQATPEATPDPYPIPEKLVQMLVRLQPDWTSSLWAQLFKDCCRLV